MSLDAIVFDFDGLLVDTEQPSYEAWAEQFTRRGVELRLERWIDVVGTHDATFDPIEELEQLTGQPVDGDAVRSEADARFIELAHEQPPRPGVLPLLDEARSAGVRLAVASSSRSTWVEGHLQRLGLRDRFEAVVGRDLVGWKGKPDPAVYLEALARIDVPADRAVAIEDSAHGVRSARAAGLPAIAVPNAVTRILDFEGAAAVLPSLEGTTLSDLRAHLRNVA